MLRAVHSDLVTLGEKYLVDLLLGKLRRALAPVLKLKVPFIPYLSNSSAKRLSCTTPSS